MEPALRPVFHYRYSSKKAGSVQRLQSAFCLFLARGQEGRRSYSSIVISFTNARLLPWCLLSVCFSPAGAFACALLGSAWTMAFVRPSVACSDLMSIPCKAGCGLRCPPHLDAKTRRAGLRTG